MKSIKVFEYHSLQQGVAYKGVTFNEKHFNALVKLNELHKNKYFTVGYKKITFKNFVGVIQIDGLTIEILPKIDHTSNDVAVWQNVLLNMLKVTRKIKVQDVGNAYVKKQNIHLLDIYFEWFLSEVELLIHQGLIKKYYKKTSNVKALKGKLEFAGHISKNLVHKEWFYTSHQIYGKNHLIHQILNQALSIISQLSKGSYIYNKCKKVQLAFPEVSEIKVNVSTFKKVVVSRKISPYKTALAIARLIILNYAPNVSSGKEHMLALLFDMNNLWEEYILASLQQVAAKKSFTVYGQQSKEFWNGVTVRPDIVIKNKNGDESFVIDTKWKNIDNSKPSISDLRQMYVYNDYWKANKSMLLYPSKITEVPNFIKFKDTSHHNPEDHCAIGKLNILQDDKLKLNIGEEILTWFD